MAAGVERCAQVNREMRADERVERALRTDREACGRVRVDARVARERDGRLTCGLALELRRCVDVRVARRVVALRVRLRVCMRLARKADAVDVSLQLQARRDRCDRVRAEAVARTPAGG